VTLRIAVASDLHCHDTKEQIPPESFLCVDTPASPWRANPLEALYRFVGSEGLKVHGLVCPGDIANRCSEKGLTFGWNAMRELGSRLNAQFIVSTVGNHDVDSRKKHGPHPFAIVRRLGGGFPVPSPADTARFWKEHFCRVAAEGAHLLILNSSAHHNTVEEAEHGAVNDETLEAIESELESIDGTGPRLAILHHHPHLHEDINLGAADVMHGGQKFIDLLTLHGFGLVVHGHKHHPKISYGQGGTTSPTIFASASLSFINKGALSTITRNLFHVIEIETDHLAGCTTRGTVLSWEFNYGTGWRPTVSRSGGLPHRAGFGCRMLPLEIGAMIVEATPANASWKDIETAIPQLKHMIPTDLKLLLNWLREDAEYDVLFDDNALPAAIWRRNSKP
jgi:hypothetical protein